jgi:beta-lactamase class C
MNLRAFVLAASLIASPFEVAIAADSLPPSPGPTLPSPVLSPEALGAQRLAEFAALLDRAAATDDFVGLAVAVVSKGEIKILKTYGVTEAGGVKLVTPNTVFRLASLSKGFGASLAGLAMVEGKISLATPVAPYAPKLALSGGAQSLVTVDHILSHRVGLPPNAYDNLLEAGVPVGDILPRFKSVKPICKVGQCYAYQNITFSLIGDILSSAYGEPYEQLVRTRLFEPLGMRNASVGVDGLTGAADWARPHSRTRIKGVPGAYTPWRVATVNDAYYRTPAAGGVNASITDMARWLIAQMGGAPEVLPQAVLDEIHAPVVASPAETRRQGPLQARVKSTKYARGWRVYEYAGQTVVTHSGGVEGYGAQIAFMPDRDIGIVVLANTRTQRVFRIAASFFDIELGLDDQDWLELETPMLAGDGAEPVASGGQ